MSGFKSEQVSGFRLECASGFIGIRIVSMQGSNLTLIDASNATAKASLPLVPAPSALTLSPNGRWIMSSGNDGIGRIWDLGNGAWRAVAWHEGPIKTAQFSRDGGRILTVGGDRLGDARVVHIDELVRMGARRTIAGPRAAQAGFAVDLAGSVFYATEDWPQGGVRVIRRLDMATGSTRKIWLSTADISSIAYSPETNVLFVQGADDILTALDVANEKSLWTSQSTRSPNGAPQVIGSGRLVLANETNTSAPILIDARDGTRIHPPGPGPRGTILRSDSESHFLSTPTRTLHFSSTLRQRKNR